MCRITIIVFLSNRQMRHQIWGQAALNNPMNVVQPNIYLKSQEKLKIILISRGPI